MPSSAELRLSAVHNVKMTRAISELTYKIVAFPENSQALAGIVGTGKVVALGDSNGFIAMTFDRDDGTKQKAGMNLENYDWKQFVLNTLHWLSTE